MQVYVIADHDMVYAENAQQALDIFQEETGIDEFGLDEVEEATDGWLDSQVWNQDDGEIDFDGKTVRQIISEYQGPQYMWGWE